MQTPSIPVAPSAAPQRTVVLIIVAVYLVLAGLFSFCVSLTLVLAGGVVSNLNLGSITSQSTAGLSATDVAAAQQVQNAVASAQGGSGLLVILGVVLLIVGIAYLVTGIGLFLVRPWAYLATVVISAVLIVVNIAEALVIGNFTFASLILPIISLAVIAYFLTNEDTKRAFGRV